MKLTIENNPNRNDIVNKDKETLKLRRRYTLMAIEMWEGAPDAHERKEYNIDYFKKELEIIDKELEKLQNKTIQTQSKLLKMFGKQKKCCTFAEQKLKNKL